MSKRQKIEKISHPDQISSYFKLERFPLAMVTASGIIYNIGMTAGPYFEGKLAQRLFEILNGSRQWRDMVTLVALYLLVILTVQTARCLKRFYVRRFANDAGRNMRHMLYNSLVHKKKPELEQESIGAVMTKAVADVDTCVEGMRKFTTEIFDTGVVLAAYLTMMCWYDWRLTILACVFTPLAYWFADKLKVAVIRYNGAYKKSAGKLNDATLDRISNAVTYRVYGREEARNAAYDERLADYEKWAVAANVWETSMKPVYNIISMIGVIPLLYFGARNVLGTGWTVWDIGVFTTFLSCFTKMAAKSSSAAKLFNAVQKARVSWKRIKPLMEEYQEEKDIIEQEESRRHKEKEEQEEGRRQTEKDRPEEYRSQTEKEEQEKYRRQTEKEEQEEYWRQAEQCEQKKSWKSQNNLDDMSLRKPQSLSVSNLSFTYPDGQTIFESLSFEAEPGQIIGITGPVASGKSTLGKVFLCEYPYEGSVRIGNWELAKMDAYIRSRLISYTGHQSELMSDTLEENIRLGDEGDLDRVLRQVCLMEEVQEMSEGIAAFVGNGGIRLSGGQQARAALARTLYHGRHILILDDPFSAVDRKTEEKILENIREFARDKIVLLISHRLYHFPEFDQVIWLNEGRGTVSTHAELMQTNPLYAQLFKTQMSGGDLDEIQEKYMFDGGNDCSDSRRDCGSSVSTAGT